MSSNLFIPNFLFPTAAKLFLWIVVEKFLPLFLVCPSIFSFLFVFRSNVFQSFSNSCQIIVMDRSCSREIPSYISSPIPRDLYLLSLSLSNCLSLSILFILSFICLRIFRLNVYQSFSNSCQIIIMDRNCSREIPFIYFFFHSARSLSLSLFFLSYLSSNLSFQRFPIFFQQIITFMDCRKVPCAHFFSHSARSLSLSLFFLSYLSSNLSIQRFPIFFPTNYYIYES